MGQCLIHRTSAPFKAFILATATPGSTVTATLGDKVFTGVADSSTGQVTITVKKKGTYSVTSNATGTQTTSVAVVKSKQTYNTTVTGAFTLSITNAIINSKTAATVTVNRKSSIYGGGATGDLATNATIYYGDVLTISVANADSTVYNAPSVKVNDNAHTSGDDFTVANANVSTVASSSVKSWTLTITNATINSKSAATITVHRDSSTYQGANEENLATNATIYYGDVLKISVANANSTVYNSPTLKVNNSAFTSGNTHTVTAAVAAVASSSVKSWSLTLKATNCTLAVSRTSSTYQGAGSGALSNGSTVYYGDVISKTSGGANTGFSSYTITQSGVTGTANTGPWTVTGAASLKATVSPTKYTLTSSGLNGNNPVTIKRTARSAAGTAANVATNVNLSNGAAIYYDDTLQFTNAPKANYNGSYSVSGSTSGNVSNQTATLSRYVRGNVTVTSTASAVVYSFTVKSSSAVSGIGYTKDTVLNFNYTPVNITTFANLVSNSTYRWSTTTTSKNNKTWYYCIESGTTSGGVSRLQVLYNSSKSTSGTAVVGLDIKYSGVRVKPTENIVKGRQYVN